MWKVCRRQSYGYLLCGQVSRDTLSSRCHCCAMHDYTGLVNLTVVNIEVKVIVLGQVARVRYNTGSRNSEWFVSVCRSMFTFTRFY